MDQAQIVRQTNNDGNDNIGTNDDGSDSSYENDAADANRNPVVQARKLRHAVDGNSNGRRVYNDKSSQPNDNENNAQNEAGARLRRRRGQQENSVASFSSRSRGQDDTRQHPRYPPRRSARMSNYHQHEEGADDDVVDVCSG